MARTKAGLPPGTRVTDFISLGVVAHRFPLKRVQAVLERTGRASQRQRQLPAHVVVYYVIALALFMTVSYGEVLRCLVEGLSWLGWPVERVRRTGPSGISQARTRLGWEPLRELYRELVRPLATRRTRGAWYRHWRLVTLDGTTLDVADTPENEAAFGRPGASRGRSGFPQLRWVCLAETGTHVLFAAAEGAYRESERALAARVLGALRRGMLCLADRGFFSFAAWREASETGAALVWRVRRDLVLPCRKRLADGSYLSRIYPSRAARRQDRGGIDVRVIEYCLEGVEGEEPYYRLITTILDPQQGPADELAALYHERWEVETAFREFKTHLRGRGLVLRSRTPVLVRQEFYGLLLAHYAVRGLMHEAALHGDVDPDRLSFVHSVRVIRRKLAQWVSFSPSAAPSPS